MQRYLVSFSYIGTKFNGVAAQSGLALGRDGSTPKALVVKSEEPPLAAAATTGPVTAAGVIPELQPIRTIQSALETALEAFIQQPVKITLSSRTDAGVHALMNTFHVDLLRKKRNTGDIAEPHNGWVVKNALNYFLQSDEIAILEARKVSPLFHARFSAIGRRYLYRVIHGSYAVPLFERQRVWHMKDSLDVEAMKVASCHLVGHHDFSSFRASGCSGKSPVRTIDEITFTEETTNPWCRRGEKVLHVEVAARSFLYNQVRNMVATLVHVGLGKMRAGEVKTLLEAKDRTKAPATAPACGLFLQRVNYPPDTDPIFTPSLIPPKNHQTQEAHGSENANH